jgi:hypothetical protein
MAVVIPPAPNTPSWSGAKLRLLIDVKRFKRKMFMNGG